LRLIIPIYSNWVPFATRALLNSGTQRLINISIAKCKSCNGHRETLLAQVPHEA
jgi:hypothetical protein